MENIDIKNFCLIIFGDHKDIDKELNCISEGKVNYLHNNNIFLATFKSVLFAKDIEIILSDTKFKFIICEIVPSLFSVNLGKLTKKLFDEKINDQIFKCEETDHKDIETKMEADLNLDQLLDLISEKGYDSLTQKQKEKLNFLSTKH